MQAVSQRSQNELVTQVKTYCGDRCGRTSPCNPYMRLDLLTLGEARAPGMRFDCAQSSLRSILGLEAGYDCL
jgi:hypothetical protein